jgi:excisionase family DNA binding protein
MGQSEEVYYTVAEVAKRLRVTPQAVYKWIKQNRIAVVYAGSDRRITRSALLTFIEQSTRQHLDRDGTIQESDELRSPSLVAA